jgi:kynurenine formamidase
MKLATAVTAAAAALSVVAGSALAQDCKPSKWGAKDEIGNANLVTPARVKAALGLVKQGKTHPLGIIIDSSTPAFPPRTLSLEVVQPNQQGGQRLFAYKGSYNDDLVQTWLGIGPQIDGLGHLGQDGMYYNCNNEKDFAAITGLKKLGTEKIPPIVARGVLIDMAKHFGKPFLEAGKYFTAADIRTAAKAQKAEIREGDVVLFHSGWLNLIDGEAPDTQRYASTEPGLGKTGAEYLAELNVVAVGADTWGLEAVPFEDGVGVFEIHQILIPRHGSYILENMDTREMVRDEAWEFMFVLGVTRMKGAVQMMINPTAIR